jgi:epoxyqueuosine reductase QueG
MNLEGHPSVRRYLAGKAAAPSPPQILSAAFIRRAVLEAGADDVGIASIDSAALAAYRSRILTLFPEAKACVSVVCRMNHLNVRSPYRQQYELEYHHMYAEVDQVARRGVVALMAAGAGAMDVCSSYPMNMERWPDEGMWYVAHKPVAAAAGMGHMGLNRLIIHPRFGAFIALATILIDREVDAYDRPADFDPCVKCMLCVTSCPVGALNADGHFNSIACVTHSYRLKYGGFTDFIETVAASRDARQFHSRFSDQETVLAWQALALGTSYQCTNCMAVCPGGDELIGPYVEDAKAYRETVAARLQQRAETVYVVKGSDADAHVRKRFPHKPVRYVHNGVRASTVAAFVDNLGIMFQRQASKGLNATYHFRFTGRECLDCTITIGGQKMTVERGLARKADVRVVADSQTWLEIINGRRGGFWPLVSGKLRVSGKLSLFRAFARCFPS